MSFPSESATGFQIECRNCRALIPAAVLVCPSCHALVHAEELNQLAGEADVCEGEGDFAGALQSWRAALDKVPPGTTQFEAVRAKIAALSEAVDKAPVSARAPRRSTSRHSGAKLAGGAGAAFLLLSKAKILLLGLTKATTLLTMLLSFGFYWKAWGWKFAVGLIGSIYVHEMGHVSMLVRLGFPFTAPMFLPGIGAVIRLNQQVINPREDARIGLAGPIWGTGAAVFCLIVYFATRYNFWLALAHIGAWINLFNLMPVWQLDGGRGFHSLAKFQRWIAVAVVAAAYLICKDGVLVLIGILGVVKTLGEKGAEKRDNIALAQYVGLVGVLTAIIMVAARK